PFAATRLMAEAGIEETRIVHAEFAHQRIVGHHLGRMRGRHPYRLARGEDVELVGVEDEGALLADRLPIIEDLERGLLVDIDESRMALGAEADRLVTAAA